MLVSAESTDRKRTAMRRFKERLAALTGEETDMVTRCHRRYVKTIPGKLDHASLVAVNLGKMRTLNSYYLLSADARTTEYSFTARRNGSTRSLEGLGKSPISPIPELSNAEVRRGSLM